MHVIQVVEHVGERPIFNARHARMAIFGINCKKFVILVMKDAIIVQIICV